LQEAHIDVGWSFGSGHGFVLNDDGIVGLTDKLFRYKF